MRARTRFTNLQIYKLTFSRKHLPHHARSRYADAIAVNQ